MVLWLSLMEVSKSEVKWVVVELAGGGYHQGWLSYGLW